MRYSRRMRASGNHCSNRATSKSFSPKATSSSKKVPPPNYGHAVSIVLFGRIRVSRKPARAMCSRACARGFWESGSPLSPPQKRPAKRAIQLQISSQNAKRDITSSRATSSLRCTNYNAHVPYVLVSRAAKFHCFFSRLQSSFSFPRGGAHLRTRDELHRLDVLRTDALPRSPPSHHGRRHRRIFRTRDHPRRTVPLGRGQRQERPRAQSGRVGRGGYYRVAHLVGVQGFYRTHTAGIPDEHLFARHHARIPFRLSREWHLLGLAVVAYGGSRRYVGHAPHSFSAQ